MLSPPLTGSARKNPGDDEVQVPGQPTSDSQLGKNASRADAKNGNTNSGMGPRDLGFGVIPGNDSIGHSSSWVIPRKINGPVKIPKSDGATLFVCSFAQPSSNFSRDPETTTINVIK